MLSYWDKVISLMIYLSQEKAKRQNSKTLESKRF